MRHKLIIPTIFLFSFIIFSCGEKEESSTTTTSTTTTSSPLFVSVGNSGTILTSSDGTTWTKVTATYTSDNGSTETPSFNDVTYGNGTFVAVNPNGIILTSTDVTSSWHLRTSGTTNDLNGVTYKE